MEKLERRIIVSGELRAAANEPRLTGLAVPYAELSEDLGGFREIIRNGAFRDSLAQFPVVGLHAHDPANILASTRGGGLRLWETPRGVQFDMALAPTQLGRDVYTLVQRGDLGQMSFGFRTVSDTWPHPDRREVITARLYEISTVPFPAYSQTSVQARSDRDGIGPLGVYHLRPTAGDVSEAGHLRRRLRLRQLEVELAQRGEK